MLTKTSSDLLEILCSALATSSLPVPFSPSISTFASVPATLSIVRNTFCIATEFPVMSEMLLSEILVRYCCFDLTRSSSRRDSRSLKEAEYVASSFSFCHGLRTKSVAPSLMARTAILTSPKAVINITTACGSIFNISLSQ